MTTDVSRSEALGIIPDGKWFPTGRDASFKSQILFFGIVQAVLRVRMLLLLPFLARVLGTKEYGTWAALTAFSSAVIMVTSLGTPTALRVFIPGLAKTERTREFWTMLNAVLVVTALVAAFLLAFHAFFTESILGVGAPFSLYATVIAITSLTVLTMLLEAQIVNNHQGKSLSRITIWTSLVNLVSVSAGAWFAGLNGVFFALMLTILVQMLLSVPVVGRTDPPRFGFGDLGILRKYFSYGFNVFLAGALFWVIDLADRVLLGRFVSGDEVGIYHVVCSICSEAALVGAPVFVALLPQLRKATEINDAAQFHQHMNNSFRVLALLYGFGLVFLWANGADILHVLTSESFVPGARYFPFVASAMLFSQMAALITYGFHARKSFSRSLLPLAAAAGLSVGINILLIPRYGAMAAATSRVIAFGLYLLGVLVFSRKMAFFTFSASLVMRILLVLLVCGAASVLTGMLPLTPYFRLPISVLAGMGCFVVLSLKLNLIHRDELSALRKVLNAFVPGLGKGNIP